MTTGLTSAVDAATHYKRPVPASNPKSDASSVVLTVGSRLVFAASQAVVLVLIARLGGTQETASFIWAMALTAPVFMFTNMNLRELISTETTQGHGVRDYWSARLLTTAIGLAMLAVIVSLVAPVRDWTLIAAVAAVKALESINDLVLGAYHRCERADRAAVSLSSRSIGGCLCLAVILAVTSNVTAGLIGMLLFHTASMVVYDSHYIGQFGGWRQLSRPSSIAPILRTAFPLGFVACLTSLSLNIPRYTVHGQLDDQSLAAFGCCASFLQLFALVGVSTQLALSPRIALRNAQSRRLMNEMLWRNVVAVSCVGVAVIIAAHVWGTTILSAIYGREYGVFGPILTWLMIAGTFSAAKGFLATGLTAARSTASQAAIAAAQFGCSALVCIWFVPIYGVIAAAWAVAASSFLSFVLHVVWTLAGRQEVVRT